MSLEFSGIQRDMHDFLPSVAYCDCDQCLYSVR